LSLNQQSINNMKTILIAFLAAKVAAI